MKRVLKLSLAVAFIVGCQDPGVQPPVGDFSAIIVDGHFNSGNGAFFWLPPLVPDDDTGFNTFDPDVRPTIEICPLKDDASGPGGRVCETDNDGNRVVDARFSPSEIDGASNHYHVKFNTKSVRRNRLYRIIASIGSTDEGDIVLAELGIRDVGIGNVACSIDDPSQPVLCVSGELQIKFRIDLDAICFGVDDCAGGTLTSGGQSFVLTSGGVQGATPSGTQTELSLLFNEVDCEPASRVIGLDSGIVASGIGFNPVQWALYAPCFKITTSPVITDVNIDVLLENGLLGYEVCVDHPAGMTSTQKARSRLARMSTDSTELQILDRDDTVDVVATCSPPAAAGLGAKLWKFARGLFHKVGGPFAPEPVYAARGFFRRGDYGVGGFGPKSFVGVVTPAVLNNVTTLDLGVRSPGESILVELDARDAGGELVEGNDVTFKTTLGDTFNDADSTVVRTPASGLAAGNWVLANDAAGTRTLTASCFPCGDPPVTGDGGGDDPFEDLTLSDSQTFTFIATVLDLSINIPGGQGRLIVNTSFMVEICIGADVQADVRLSGRANNGSPTEIQVVGIDPIDPYEPPVIPVGTAGFETVEGCVTVDVIVTKSGGVRLVAELLNDSGGVIEVEEALKVNIRPK